MKWLKWTCAHCGQENHTSRPSLPRPGPIDVVCRECRVKSQGVSWVAASAPDRTVQAEDGRWTCPFCKAQNDVPAGTVGFARRACSVCDSACGVLFPGGLDAPAGESEPDGSKEDLN